MVGKTREAVMFNLVYVERIITFRTKLIEYLGNLTLYTPKYFDFYDMSTVCTRATGTNFFDFARPANREIIPGRRE